MGDPARSLVGQPKHITVGVEKEALAGVFEDVCRELGVGMFVFRGYASLSSIYQWAKNLEDAYVSSIDQEVSIDEAVLLYFGDHDPDGWEIPRSALRNVEEIAEVDGLDAPPVRLERVALNMDQIRRYDPPPFEAKLTSSRYASYWDEHGTDEAWELDALRPDVLQDLIREAVNAEFTESIYRANRDLVSEQREVVRTTMRTEEWMRRALR